MPDPELVALCRFFEKYGDHGGQYDDQDWLVYNRTVLLCQLEPTLPSRQVRGIWFCGDEIERGGYIGRRCIKSSYCKGRCCQSLKSWP
jgi:hypothetical protein